MSSNIIYLTGPDFSSRDELVRYVVKSKPSNKRLAKYVRKLTSGAVQPTAGELNEVRAWCRTHADDRNVKPARRSKKARNRDEELRQGDATSGSSFASQWFFDEDHDTYTTIISGLPEVRMSGVEHRAILSSYSNADGTPASVERVARMANMPRAHMVKYLKAHGITHDSLPFTDHELQNRSSEDLEEEYLVSLKRTIANKLESARIREDKRDADKWRKFRAYALEPLLDTIAKHAPRYEKIKALKIKAPSEPFAAVISLQDIHQDAYCSALETGREVNEVLMRNMVLGAMGNLLADICAFGRPETIIMSVGGADWSNGDQFNGATTNNTPQDSSTTHATSIVNGFFLAVECVDMALQVSGSVKLKMVPGNHDRVTSVSTYVGLHAWYRNQPEVETSVSLPGDMSPFQKEVYGSTLVLMHHGDGVKDKDSGAIIMAYCRRELAAADHVLVVRGHLHHLDNRDYAGGIEVMGMRSPSPADRWHTNNGYIGGSEGINAKLIRRKSGPFCTLFAPTSLSGCLN